MTSSGTQTYSKSLIVMSNIFSSKITRFCIRPFLEVGRRRRKGSKIERFRSFQDHEVSYLATAVLNSCKNLAIVGIQMPGSLFALFSHRGLYFVDDCTTMSSISFFDITVTIILSTMTAFHRRHLRKREERRNGLQKRATVKRIESVFKSSKTCDLYGQKRVTSAKAIFYYSRRDVFSLEEEYKRVYTETLDEKNDDAIISPRLLPASKYEKANSPTFPYRRLDFSSPPYVRSFSQQVNTMRNKNKRIKDRSTLMSPSLISQLLSCRHRYVRRINGVPPPSHYRRRLWNPEIEKTQPVVVASRVPMWLSG
ncbi:hypothetical protein V1478_007177 [Vespula squamosa]|uniref:Uncharacterized protein n=1 Tax=Vespula squamosa TaxID=30214 RepID=A0ABD2B2F3_VESSQ